jgi:hypothetical protein
MWCQVTTYLVAKRIGKLSVHDLAVREGDWEATTRCWVCHVDAETDGAHDGHCDDVERSGFDPLSKCRPAVVRRRTMRCHLGLLATKEANLLLVRVSAGSSRSVCCCRRRTPVEEAHCCSR